MRPKFFGDSFDIVKQSLIRWLGRCGPWSAHPMFTEPVSSAEAKVFAQLLGVPLLSREVLAVDTDRTAYFACARSCESHLFLDPDTGLRLEKVNDGKEPAYLLGEELVAIADSRPEWLTLVFDQSVARGKEREQLKHKLATFARRGLHGFAYVSHACFLLVGRDRDALVTAVKAVQQQSGLPASRFVEGRIAEQGVAADRRE